LIMFTNFSILDKNNLFENKGRKLNRINKTKVSSNYPIILI